MACQKPVSVSVCMCVHSSICEKYHKYLLSEHRNINRQTFNFLTFLVSFLHMHSVLVKVMLMAVIQNSSLILLKEFEARAFLFWLVLTACGMSSRKISFSCCLIPYSLISWVFMTLFLSADSKQDEADGRQLWGRPPESLFSKLRATQQSQALPRPGESTTSDWKHSLGINLQI